MKYLISNPDEPKSYPIRVEAADPYAIILELGNKINPIYYWQWLVYEVTEDNQLSLLGSLSDFDEQALKQQQRLAVLDELASEAQELNMGY